MPLNTFAYTIGMSNSHFIKSALHRLAYAGSVILPLPLLWEKLHARDYHPAITGIIERIRKQKKEPQNSLFVHFEDLLNMPIDLKGKFILEIGHGGGWYLAEALDAGAKQVVGLEISEEINRRAGSALSSLGYTNFQLILGNGRDLKVLHSMKFDLIFTITVLQHMPTRNTRKYLNDISSLLTPNGVCIIQALNSYGSSMKRLSSADLFSVAYSKEEFDFLIVQSGLEVVAYASEEYDSDDTFWGIYMVQRNLDKS